MLDDFEFSKMRSAADLLTQVSKKMGVLDQDDLYYDRKSGLERPQYFKTLETSTTLYVGGLPPNAFEPYLLNYFTNLPTTS